MGSCELRVISLGERKHLDVCLPKDRRVKGLKK
jgi:hypothetical protein